jgi:hypothetical protein
VLQPSARRSLVISLHGFPEKFVCARSSSTRALATRKGVLVLKMRLKATLRNRRVPSVRSRPFLDPFMIHEAFLTLTETALGSHPRCVVSVTYDRTSYFHGGNTGSNPVGDAKSNQALRLRPAPTVHSAAHSAAH